MTDTDTAYNEGYEAYALGIPLDGHGYALERLVEAFEEGWYDCKLDFPHKCPTCGVHQGHPDDLAPGVPFDCHPFCSPECRAVGVPGW